MTCAHCGASTSAADTPCRSCGRRLPSGRDVATGVLTPIPAQSGETNTDAPALNVDAGLPEEQTRVPGVQPGIALTTSGEDSGATTYQPPDPDQTSYVPAPVDD